MLLTEKTYCLQQKLADYCRTGERFEIEGTVENRLPRYRNLIITVVNDTLESAFPIFRSHTSNETWNQLVEQFFAAHDCQTPQIWKLGGEFYNYLIENNYASKLRMPYLNDLLRFEWLEIEMYMMEDIPYPDFKKDGDIFKNTLVLNPEYQLLKLEHPVHILPPDSLPEKPSNYFLLTFREKDSGSIQFVNLSVLFAFVVESIGTSGKALDELIPDMLYYFGINDLELLRTQLQNFVEDLINRGFILGTKC